MNKFLTFAEARALKVERGSLIVPERQQAPVFRIGDKALFVDDWRQERVTVASVEWLHPETGEPMRTCVFHGQGEYDVKAVCLAALPGAAPPVALRSGKDLGLPAIVTDEGRLYQPEPFRERPRPHPVMDKFDRIAAVEPPPARLDPSALSEAQIDLLRQADEKLASAERRKDDRARRNDKGRIVGYGRRTQAEKEEREFARNVYASLGLGAQDKQARDEVKRGRAESFALADARGRLERREAAKAVRAQYAEHRHPYCWFSPRRRVAIAKELRDLRTALIEEARASVMRDIAAGGRRVTRDGLDFLPLTEIQRSSALWYRGLYERTERAPKIAGIGYASAGELRDRPAKDWGAEQVMRRHVEAKVMAASRNGRGLTALRLVAGEGRTINAISGGKSSNRKLNAEALIVALDVIADCRSAQ